MTTLLPVKSSNIAAIGHDPAKSELHVKFKTGATHVYAGVPTDKHKALMAAESIGSHFHANIRDKHPQRQITGPTEAAKPSVATRG